MQMQNRRQRLLFSLCANLLLAALELTGAVLSFRDSGAGALQFYTEDSNLLNLAACALWSFFVLRALRRGAEIPAWVRRLKYVALCCLTITFLVVVLVLAPLMGGYTALLLRGSMLYNHLLCPLLALALFLFVDRRPALPRRAFLSALLPTALYAAVTVALNLARVLVGPYPFLRVYAQPVLASVFWCFAILGGALLVAFLLQKLDDALSRGREH